MDRKKFSGILDEAVSQLEQEVRGYKSQKATLIINLKDLEAMRDKLSQQISELEIKLKELKVQAEKEKEEILKTVKEKLSNANQKEVEATQKVTILDEKIKDADDLIKSNEGRSKNLEIQELESKNKLEKINEVIKLAHKL